MFHSACVLLMAMSFTSGQSQPEAAPPPPAALKALETIELPGVEGRIDHMATDLGRQRLLVAAHDNGSLEVVDIGLKKRIKSVGKLRHPQGVLYIADSDRVVVACGGTGTCDVFSGGTLEPETKIVVGDDADNVRYDAHTKLLYVGWGAGALAIIDTRTWKVVANVEVGGHPESFQFDAKGERAFVNVAERGEVVVVDLAQRAVVDSWPLKDAELNFPMAIQGADRRLFVACRRPSLFLVLDPKNGRRTDGLALSGDADDIAFDEASGRAFVSCGAGSIDVFERGEKGEYRAAGKLATAAGARTCLFVPGLERLYLAVPKRGEKPAEIRVFENVR